MTETINLERVLERVNQARVALGEQPLEKLAMGVKDDGTDCPLANSLDGGTVTVDYWGAFFETPEIAAKVRAAWGVSYRASLSLGVQFPPDEDIARFPTMFDSGELPEFDQAAAEWD